jgi:O-antigen ligase
LLLKFGIPVVLLMIVFTLIVGTDSVAARFQEQNALTIRKPLAESTIQMIRERPLTGFGLGTWRLVYPQFATIDFTVVANEAHDDWLQWAAEGGVPFAFVLLLLAAWLSSIAWKHLWGLGVPAVFLHCCFDYPTHLPALAAVFFLMAGALAATAARGKKPEEQKESEWSVIAVRTES